ncbi:C40 family peptidase [Solibacillus sp. FSL H8-0538]|uniref:C40 family peptidase n=1 Tax=Solibacillus sp. FSL H8-0538 TaxID=2921400 RepID=UPI0030FB2D92
MNHYKLLGNMVLAFVATFVIFFTPIGENEAAAASSATLTTEELKTTASKYIGVRYSYGGTTTSGFDCSGYVRYVFNELGVSSLQRTSSSMYGQGEAVKKSDLTEGDLVFFNTSGSGISHVGIYIGSGKFIHSSTSEGVTITKLDDPYYWSSKYVGAKRIATVQTAKEVAAENKKVEEKEQTNES